MSGTAILVEGLAKRFGDVVALDGIDFQVPAGSVFGLLGPNGAGKTTAIRILTTILRPDGGRAEVLGLDVVSQADEVRYRIGLAGQYAAVDPNLTGRENLRLTGRLAQLPAADAQARAAELLGRFGLTDAADRPARTYSGGMRRRLDVAAALVQRPQVVFLDEPTTGLDIYSRNALWEMIRELVAYGTTVLLTTQYLEEADRLAQRIAVVDGGRVIANDTPAALKAQLGSTVIELGMGEAARALQAGDLLAERLRARPERDGPTVRLTSGDGSRLLIDVLRLLDDHQLAPVTLALREPSMDDVFLAITGHRAEGEAPAEGEAAADGQAAAGRALAAEVAGEHRRRGPPRAARPAAAPPRRPGGRRAQPDRLPPRAAAAGLLHHPAGHLRAAVPLRVWRRGADAPGRPLRRLPDPGGSSSRRPCSAPSAPRSAWRPTSRAGCWSGSVRSPWRARPSWPVVPRPTSPATSSSPR
jgi:ABC-2 type transport system ATP-binding protein